MKRTKFRKFLDLLPAAGTFTRQELIKRTRSLSPEQIDNYRLHLERAGYIWTGFTRGKYHVIQDIPSDLKWRELIRQAYPDRFKRSV